MNSGHLLEVYSSIEVLYLISERFVSISKVIYSVITIMGPFGDHGQEAYFGHLLLHSVNLTPIDFNFCT